FHAGQSGTEAEVHAPTKRELLVRIGPPDVEHIWIWKLLWIAIGGCECQQQLCSRRNRHPAHHRLPGGYPPPRNHRGIEAERFFDRSWNERWIGAQLLPHARVLGR